MWPGDAQSPATLAKPFWAEVLSFDPTPRKHSWREVLPGTTGGPGASLTWTVKAGGRSGQSLYALDGRRIRTGDHVYVDRGYYDPVAGWVYITDYTGRTAPVDCAQQQYDLDMLTCDSGVLKTYRTRHYRNVDAAGCLEATHDAPTLQAVGGCCGSDDLCCYQLPDTICGTMFLPGCVGVSPCNEPQPITFRKLANGCQWIATFGTEDCFVEFVYTCDWMHGQSTMDISFGGAPFTVPSFCGLPTSFPLGTVATALLDLCASIPFDCIVSGPVCSDYEPGDGYVDLFVCSSAPMKLGAPAAYAAVYGGTRMDGTYALRRRGTALAGGDGPVRVTVAEGRVRLYYDGMFQGECESGGTVAGATVEVHDG